MSTTEAQSRSAYMAAYRAKHKEELAQKAAVRASNRSEESRAARNARNAVYYAKNRSAIIEKRTAKALVDPGHMKALKATSRLKRKDSIREKDAAYYQSNKRRILSRNSDYWKRNPDVKRRASATRRARVASAEGRLSAGIFDRLMRLQRGKCANCKVDIRDSADLDHILPLALGGSNDDANVQLLCVSCNRSKQAKHPSVWAKLNGRLL